MKKTIGERPALRRLVKLTSRLTPAARLICWTPIASPTMEEVGVAP